VTEQARHVNPGTPDARAELAIEAAGLRADIAGSHILQGVDLAVRTGGVTALLGRNGVGKTTTLRALLGLQARTGSIQVLGHDVIGWPTHKIIQLGVGYVPEDRDVFARLTVRENLRLAEAGSGPRYDLVYELFPELKRRSRQLAGTLSGGQQQMLAIGRVLLADRSLLLVDEPTKGLSPLFVSEVVDVLARISASTTILMVEQNVHVVRRLARDVIVLDHGRVVHAGPAAGLSDAGLVQRLLGVSGAA
jgi:branched-chain amino acid transport system ATP-binding protein